MDRDLATEIDALREELRAVGTDVRALREGEDSAGRTGVAEGPRRWDTPEIRRATDELRSAARARGAAGIVRSSGYYAAGDDSGSGEALWVDEERTADELLAGDQEGVAHILAALGNGQRLAILAALLGGPASAGELVRRLGLGTTGQAYHHLNALQAADLVRQSGRGRFAVPFERVPACLTLLAGARALAEARYGLDERNDDDGGREGRGKE